MSKQQKLTTEKSSRGLETKVNAPQAEEYPADMAASFDEIHKRADTISPVLQQLLDFRPPPHWGIND